MQFASEFPTAVCQPSVNGRPKHPVVFPAEIFYTLAASACPTLRDFLEQNASERRVMECLDPALEFDVDTPEDYAHAVQRFAASSREIA
jgi:CTP:molybdopterin cytidylyltransferase MocA